MAMFNSYVSLPEGNPFDIQQPTKKKHDVITTLQGFTFPSFEDYYNLCWLQNSEVQDK